LEDGGRKWKSPNLPLNAPDSQIESSLGGYREFFCKLRSGLTLALASFGKKSAQASMWVNQISA
jgi:hypothetical protein